MLNIDVERFDADIPEIQSVDISKVVEDKVKRAYDMIKKPVIAEDTGLFCQDLQGLPGAFVKFFEKTIGYKKLCSLIGRNRKAVARTAIGYCDGKVTKSFVGEIKGKIAPRPAGKAGFGWDAIFIPDGSKKTFGQMSAEEKNMISMRKVAIEKFKKNILPA